jgi:hypothetical protein
MKPSELTGAQLDWAVVKCEGGTDFWYDTIATYWIKLDGKDRALSKGWSQSFTPSTDWAQGGPIIEREMIDLQCWSFHSMPWKASIDGGTDAGIALYVEHGTTPLVAAMRCFVASKLGDNIDIPEELK